MKYDKAENKSIDQEYFEIVSPEESPIDLKLIQEMQGALNNLRNDLEKIIDENYDIGF